MIIRKSAYYHRFSCIADQCPDSCCKEWDVQIDSATAEKYQTLSGELGSRLRAVMKHDPTDGWVMINEHNRCPMWREDGLCQIQKELGADALCKTCREYPRLTHDYGDFIELGLELSCPEAARLILTTPDAPMTETEVSGNGEIDYDQEAMALLLSSRKQALALIASPDHSIPQMLTLLLFYGHQIQAALDGETPPEFDVDAVLASAPDLAQRESEDAFLDLFRSLDILTEAWAKRLRSPAPAPWTEQIRALTRYMVERYWLQAVSDGDLICRVKLTLATCILIRLLGGDPFSTAQLFSKEIENNIDNVDAILDGAYTSPVLTDRALLGFLI